VKKISLFLAAVAVAAATACGAGNAPADGANMEDKSGLTAIRLIGQKHALEEMAKAAAKVRSTESHYDAKGRLVLPAPPNYDPEDFGRLLDAIGPHTGGLQGLQMLGPHGGVVDDNGVEHPDD
jgi:hypothetical protein